jgi:hypothetical protein
MADIEPLAFKSGEKNMSGSTSDTMAVVLDFSFDSFSVHRVAGECQNDQSDHMTCHMIMSPSNLGGLACVLILEATMTVLSHIASQTKSNIEFLVSQGQLDDIDCRPLLVKLEAILQSLGGAAPALSPVQISKTDRLSPEPPPFSSIGTDYKVLFRARAVYGYNEHDQVIILSFVVQRKVETFSRIRGTCPSLLETSLKY